MALRIPAAGLATVWTVLVVAFIEFAGNFGSLTQAQTITVGILLVAAVLWVSEWVPLFVVSFLILAFELIWLAPALNNEAALVSSSLFFGAFFSDIILLFLGGFVLSALMQKYGLDIRFAQAILTRTHGRASLTLLGIIFASAFLSMWVSNTATTAMMLTIVFPLIKNIPEHRFKMALVLSIPFACNIGGMGTPIGTPPNAIALSYLEGAGVTIGFGLWMALALPFVVLLLVFLWRLLLWLYPAGNLVLEIKERPTAEFTRGHYAAVAVFVCTALAWLFGGSLGLSTGTVALFPIIVCFGSGLLQTADFRSLPWDILYIICGGLALGVALDASGLGQVLVLALPEGASAVLIIGIVLTLVLSTVMSNTATAGLMIPLAISMDLSGNSLVALVAALAMTCSMAMALPVTTPPNAIAFSSRVINSRDMLLAGSIMSVVGVVVLLLLGVPWWRWVL